jgi:hypothetical protein
MMRLSRVQHRAYCGVDLHARTMYLRVLGPEGRTLPHDDRPATREALLAAIAPHRDGLVVACERMFVWYWLAEACAAEGIPSVLGHTVEMRAIHGTKPKNDRPGVGTTPATRSLPVEWARERKTDGRRKEDGPE